MAADLMVPTMSGDQHHQLSRHLLALSRPAHSRSQSCQAPPPLQISPISFSDATSSLANSTPPSPKAYHSRQNRPIYMPAVLRPCDEFPSSIMTRCKTRDSATSDSDSDLSLRRTNSNIMSLAKLGLLSPRLSRQSAGDNWKMLQGTWNVDLFPQVTALPTRRHWKPDAESSVCDDPTCKRNFSYFVRRHHCRRCGNIFCDWHSSYALPLDQDASFNPRAALYRACNHCFQEVKALRGRKSSHSSASTSSDPPHTSPPTPMTASPTHATPTAPRGPELAASVPRDWNWSTF